MRTWDSGSPGAGSIPVASAPHQNGKGDHPARPSSWELRLPRRFQDTTLLKQSLSSCSMICHMYEQIAANKRKAVFYVFLFIVIWLGIGAAIGSIFYSEHVDRVGDQVPPD